MLPVAALGACSGDETETSGQTTTTTESTTTTTDTTTTTTGAGGGDGGQGQGGSGGDGGSGGVIPGNFDCSAPTGAVPALKLTEVANGLSSPVLAKSAPGDDRLFIVEQGGTVRILDNGTLLDPPFLDVSGIINAGGEQGLLGLAFHPSYATTGRFFVHYSAQGDGHTVIAEYVRSADPNVADPTPVAIVLEQDQPEGNHNGGSIEFGKDGMLYIFLGDGGGGGDNHGTIGNGQDLTTKLGKVLRIDVTTLPYQSPAGNLVGGAPEIWDYGVRNPWRDSFDPCTGDLYIGDVGQGSWEEVDVEPQGMGNQNYGWRRMEGTHCYEQNCDMTGITLPVVEYDHGQGCSVTGGYVYRGAAIPGLRGTYFYGDYCQGRIWTFFYAGGQATQQAEVTDDLQSAGISISSFGQDNDGEVYVVDHGGAVYKIEAE